MGGKPRRPTWLEDQIEDDQRSVKATTCPACGKDVYVGRSADGMFWTATVDPLPVDLVDEVVAIAQTDRRGGARQSYDLIPRHGRRDLHVRDMHHIDATERRWPVLLDHVCATRVMRRAVTTPDLDQTQESLW